MADTVMDSCPYSPDGEHEWVEDRFDPPFECLWCMATAHRGAEVEARRA